MKRAQGVFAIRLSKANGVGIFSLFCSTSAYLSTRIEVVGVMPRA